MDINIQILTWVMTSVGFIGFIFAGKRKWWAWYINLACQILWATYALATGQPAFLAFAVAYFVIFARNAYLWTKDELVLRKLRSGEIDLSDISEGPSRYYWDEELEDSNLINHARHELRLLGEDDDVINWYVRVIREYASFGHSGGSHMAVMPSLTRLLNFQPLTPLTNDPEEWTYHGEDVWGKTGGIWQNKRDGRMFSNDAGVSFTCVDDPKDADGERPVYLSKVTHSGNVPA